MFRNFYPEVYYRSVYEIDFKKYYDEGRRAILFDIDNTLVMHDAPANDQAKALVDELSGIGFRMCVVSNNKGQRVSSFADAVGISYVCSAGKPGTKGYERAMELLGTEHKETMAVGDQLFTDMWGANRAGLFSVLVKPIGSDPTIKIKLKRIGEKIVFIFYRKYVKKHPYRQYIKQLMQS